MHWFWSICPESLFGLRGVYCNVIDVDLITDNTTGANVGEDDDDEMMLLLLLLLLQVLVFLLPLSRMLLLLLVVPLPPSHPSE